MALLPPPSMIMPMVTADWVAGSGVSPAVAAPATPAPMPTDVADKVDRGDGGRPQQAEADDPRLLSRRSPVAPTARSHLM